MERKIVSGTEERILFLYVNKELHGNIDKVKGLARGYV